MISALLKAFAQLADRRTRRILLWVLLLSLAVAGGLIALVATILANVVLLDIAWLDTLLDVFGGLAAALIAWMLFPAVAVMIAYLFTEAVAGAVEARYYPQLPPAKPQSLWQYSVAAVKFELLALTLNLLILPLAVIPFLQVIHPAVFYAVNGHLFGREFMEIVAPRRIDFRQTRALRRRHRGKVFVAGVIMAVLFTLPVVNLLAPVIATAFIVHVYHGLRSAEDGRELVPA